MNPAATSDNLPDTSPHPPARRRWWLPVLCVVAALAALPVALWALLRAALAPQPGEWAVTLGSGPWAVQASVMQLAWLGTSPWLGPRLDGLQLDTRLGPLEATWLPAARNGLDDAPILVWRCEPCALPLPAKVARRGGPATLRVPAAQLALMRDRVQHLRGTLMLGAQALDLPDGPDAAALQDWQNRQNVPNMPGRPPDWPDAPPLITRPLRPSPNTAPEALPATAAEADPPLITAWWQADRAPEQDPQGWLLRLRVPATPVRDWLALLNAPPAAQALAAKAGALALEAEIPTPAPASAWRVHWHYSGRLPLPMRAFPAFAQDWLAKTTHHATPRLPAPVLPADVAREDEAIER